ncbi:MAG: MFS transporter [Actinobacteria bacterium]|nr:MFS transporter [Actinomycetota bacterium]
MSATPTSGVSRLVEAIVPGRLGPDFRWLWSGFAASNLADGILLAAGPLLVTSISREPIAVALAIFLQRLPWLLLGVVAGAIIDRTDRRRLIMAVNSGRALVLASLAVAVATDSLTLPFLYATMFLIGIAETFADNAGGTLVAVTVPSRVLGQANARLMGTRVVTNEFGGPPVGAFLFTFGMAVPFGVNAVLFALAVVLVSRIELTAGDIERRGRRHLRGDVAEGVRWLWNHPPVRTLAMLITVFNITFGAAFSIWVLYALERLGLDERGFGLLMAASAVGGLTGSVVFTRLERRFAYATLLRAGLVIETLTHLGLALTRSPVVAGAVMALFGLHAATWGSVSTTIRMRAVPPALLGRVTSVYMIGSVGAFAIGTLIGGVLAQRFGIVSPFLFAFAGAAVTTALVWRSIPQVAHAGEVDPDDHEVDLGQPVH